MGIQEVIHQILSLRLCNSSFETWSISLGNSRRCEMTANKIKLQKSHLGIYVKHESLFHGKELKLCNNIDFFAKYEIIGHKLIITSKPIIIRTVLYKYCKYQLLKYKPWDTDPNSAWHYDNVSDFLFVTKWKDFLQSNLGIADVSNWQLQVDAAAKYIDLDNGNLGDHFPEEENEACEK